jgi:steroid delta-isomerase
MPTPEQIRSVVEAYVESFNKRDKEVFLATFSEMTEQVDPVGTPPRVGKQAIGAFWDDLFGICESIEFRVRDLFISGDEAALVFNIIQYHKQGGGVAIDGVDVFRVDDTGKIVAVRGYSDQSHVKTLA